MSHMCCASAHICEPFMVLHMVAVPPTLRHVQSITAVAWLRSRWRGLGALSSSEASNRYPTLRAPDGQLQRLSSSRL